MVTSVYDWMLGQKASPRVKNEGSISGTEDVLVRILKALDAEASKTPVSST